MIRCIVWFNIVFLVAVGLGLKPLYAEVWRQGAIAVGSLQDGLTLTEMGKSDEPIEVLELPTYVKGLIEVRGGVPDYAMLLASNLVLLEFRGGGYLAIERFEQELGSDAGWLDVDREMGQSRMILNLREGTLLLDQSKQAGVSQLIVETPVGRITATRQALWMIEMVRDPRKRTYSFTIHCSQGNIRLVDLMNRSFSIRTGQRISGAGAASNPSVEVAEVTSDAVDYFEGFAKRKVKVSQLEVTESALLEKMQVLSSVKRNTNTAIPEVLKSEGDQPRPVIIEYAPLPAPVTPFKGVARPPSDYAADLF